MCFAAINKMDLVGYREDVYLRLQADFLALAKHLNIPRCAVRTDQCT